jgi:hypothetical protein
MRRILYKAGEIIMMAWIVLAISGKICFALLSGLLDWLIRARHKKPAYAWGAMSSGKTAEFVMPSEV